MAERIAAAPLGDAIRIGDVTVRIIFRDNIERFVSMPARMPAPPTPQCVVCSGINSYLPPFCYRIDSFDEIEPERPVLINRRLHLEFDDRDYEDE